MWHTLCMWVALKIPCKDALQLAGTLRDICIHSHDAIYMQTYHTNYILAIFTCSPLITDSCTGHNYYNDKSKAGHTFNPEGSLWIAYRIRSEVRGIIIIISSCDSELCLPSVLRGCMAVLWSRSKGRWQRNIMGRLTCIRGLEFLHLGSLSDVDIVKRREWGNDLIRLESLIGSIVLN